MVPDLSGRYGAHTVQLDVRDFHREVCDVAFESTPAFRRPHLRADLIAEEAKETLEAITGQAWLVERIEPDSVIDFGEHAEQDLAAAIDGLCDLLCVIYGTADEFGVDLAPFWDEVHRTNMAKAGGPVREDGKRLKPEGWTPPDIAGLLARLTPSKALEGG